VRPFFVSQGPKKRLSSRAGVRLTTAEGHLVHCVRNLIITDPIIVFPDVSRSVDMGHNDRVARTTCLLFLMGYEPLSIEKILHIHAKFS
jgi:hypothetical protein